MNVLVHLQERSVHAEADPWQDAPKTIALVHADGGRYKQMVQHVARCLTKKGCGVFITANRPIHLLRKMLEEADLDMTGFRYVDCISGLTGVAPRPEPDVTFVESPTLLEKVALRAEQHLRHMDGAHRFLILDSLSTLAVYNDVDTVAELTHHLITRLRLHGIGAALLLVDKQVSPELADRVGHLCDVIFEA